METRSPASTAAVCAMPMTVPVVAVCTVPVTPPASTRAPDAMAASAMPMATPSVMSCVETSPLTCANSANPRKGSVEAAAAGRRAVLSALAARKSAAFWRMAVSLVA